MIQERLVTFVLGYEPSRQEEEKCTRLILDTLAVLVAGGVEPDVCRLALMTAHASGDDVVREFWGGRFLRRDDAARLFGMAAHVLDYDDVSMLAICHPSAPVLSAALASCNWSDTSGLELIAAYAVGTEAVVRIGQMLGARHYGLGFHATATLGTIGATAALARLHRLNHDETRNALSIATSMASGLRINFGSCVKSLHVGFAAVNAVQAARMARAGLTGSRDAFGSIGFLHAFSGGQQRSEEVEFGKPLALSRPGFEQKRFPCCYMLHRIIAGTLALRERHGLVLDQVAAIRISMAPGSQEPLIHPKPVTGMQALFSAPYAALSALHDGRIDFDSFTDKAVNRSPIIARMDDVVVSEREDLASPQGVGASAVIVQMRLLNGDTLEERVDRAPGSRDDPLSDLQLEQKWTACLFKASPGLSEDSCKDLFRKGVELPRLFSAADWLIPLQTAISTRRLETPR